MADKKSTPSSVEAITHSDAKRKNIPTTKCQSVVAKSEGAAQKVSYSHKICSLTAYPAGSSTPTTTRNPSSFATPTPSATAIHKNPSRPRSKRKSTKRHGIRLTVSDASQSFEKLISGRIAVKVINHLGDEVMKVFRVTS